MFKLSDKNRGWWSVDLELRCINGRYVFGRHGVGVNINRGESRDNLGSCLNATEERGDEDAVNREPDLRSDLLTGSESSNKTVLKERRIPRPGSCWDPEWLEVVDSIAVTHHEHVLVGSIVVGFWRWVHCFVYVFFSFSSLLLWWSVFFLLRLGLYI